jgi:hypothetical protein
MYSAITKSNNYREYTTTTTNNNNDIIIGKGKDTNYGFKPSLPRSHRATTTTFVASHQHEVMTHKKVRVSFLDLKKFGWCRIVVASDFGEKKGGVSYYYPTLYIKPKVSNIPIYNIHDDVNGINFCRREKEFLILGC